MRVRVTVRVTVRVRARVRVRVRVRVIDQPEASCRAQSSPRRNGLCGRQAGAGRCWPPLPPPPPPRCAPPR